MQSGGKDGRKRAVIRSLAVLYTGNQRKKAPNITSLIKIQRDAEDGY